METSILGAEPAIFSQISTGRTMGGRASYFRDRILLPSNLGWFRRRATRPPGRGGPIPSPPRGQSPTERSVALRGPPRPAGKARRNALSPSGPSPPRWQSPPGTPPLGLSCQKGISRGGGPAHLPGERSMPAKMLSAHSGRPHRGSWEINALCSLRGLPCLRAVRAPWRARRRGGVTSPS